MLKIIVEKWYVINRILNCFNDIKLMLFWNGVNVIHSITWLLQYIKFSVQKIISMTKVSTTDVNNIKERVKVNLEKAPEFSIPFVTETFSLKQLQSLKTDKTTKLHGLSAKYPKLSAQVISKPLAAILDLSIQSSSYPNALIKAQVTPIFKKGSKADVNNYRPISVLPIINSIFERHISNSLVNYLESNSLLYNQLSGSRKVHSCQTELTKIVDNSLHAFKNSETV